jgi:hypothetical protein
MNKAQRLPWLESVRRVDGQQASDGGEIYGVLCNICHHGEVWGDEMTCAHPLPAVHEVEFEHIWDTGGHGTSYDCWGFRPTWRTVEIAEAELKAVQWPDAPWRTEGFES